MKNFRKIKSLRNILGGLKSNLGIFRGTIYLFNLKIKIKISLGSYFNSLVRIPLKEKIGEKSLHNWGQNYPPSIGIL